MRYGFNAWYPGRAMLQVLGVIIFGGSLLIGLSGCSAIHSAAAGPPAQNGGQPSGAQVQNTGQLSSQGQAGEAQDLRRDNKSQNKVNQGEAVVPTVSAKFFADIPVLYYHSVLLEPGNELRMPPEELASQMAYLSGHGYHSITPEELEHFLAGQGELPVRPFMITFDDGYADNYLNALPILQKYKFTATVFMISSYIDGKGYLSLEQLRQLAAAGWTIGGHTVDHADLTKVDPGTLRKELLDSKALLEKDLGEPVKYFAYPFGAYNSEVEKMLGETGYSLAFTTDRGWAVQGSDPLLIHRVYCFASMGMAEFARRITNPQY